ncbi:PepSY domain-containing protein [Streptomyces sp. NPDC057217]|uniref:PepSY domain-containing protein n=1 Tax=Streptomyces sp. NPDC057217 TaxID=3346054 RepID=UPI00363DF976
MSTSLRHRLRGPAVACLAASCALLLAACGSEQKETTTTSGRIAPAQTEGTAYPSGSPSASPSGSASPRLTDDQAERQRLVPATKVTWDKATEAAVAAVPQGKLVETELTWAPPNATASGSATASASASPSVSADASAGASPSAGTGERTPAWHTSVATADGTLHDVWVDGVSGKVISDKPDADQDAEDKQELADRLKRATVTPEQAVQTATQDNKGTVTAVELDDDAWSVDVVDTGNWDKTTYEVSTTERRVLRQEVDRD